MPSAAVLVTVTPVLIGYVPETGLDHLHLHHKDGVELIHDHVHVGHHEHDSHQHSPGKADESRDDHGDYPGDRSIVVTYTRAAQVQPPAVVVETAATALEETPWSATDPVRRSTEVHPAWSPRAPPP
jgi:hypothetical protein